MSPTPKPVPEGFMPEGRMVVTPSPIVLDSDSRAELAEQACRAGIEVGGSVFREPQGMFCTRRSGSLTAPWGMQWWVDARAEAPPSEGRSRMTVRAARHGRSASEA